MHGNNTLGWRPYKVVALPPTDLEDPNTIRRKEMFIKKSECPAPLHGRGSISTPTVAVRDNGQVVVNKKAAEAFGTGKLYLIPSIEGRALTLKALATVPKGYKEEDLFKYNTNEKQPGLVFSAMAGLFKHEAVAYNFKDSGSQIFEAVCDATKNTVTFTLPAGSLPHKPVTKRVKKATPATTAPATPVLDSLD